MSDTENRKPEPTPAREPAQEKLNNFLKENNILIGTDRPDLDFTGKGQLIVSAPKIIAVYTDEIKNPAAVKQNSMN